MPVVGWLISALNVVNISNTAQTINPTFKLALLFTAAGWIAATVAAVAYSAYGFSAGNFTTVLPLKFLRATARLTVVLFVPFASLLVRPARRVTCCVGGSAQSPTVTYLPRPRAPR